MEIIGALLFGGFILIFIFGIVYFFVVQFKKWNEGKYYKENTNREFIITYFITLFVVLIMSYLTGELLWSLLIILIIIAFFKLLFEIFVFRSNKSK